MLAVHGSPETLLEHLLNWVPVVPVTTAHAVADDNSNATIADAIADPADAIANATAATADHADANAIAATADHADATATADHADADATATSDVEWEQINVPLANMIQ